MSEGFRLGINAGLGKPSVASAAEWGFKKMDGESEIRPRELDLSRCGPANEQNTLLIHLQAKSGANAPEAGVGTRPVNHNGGALSKLQLSKSELFSLENFERLSILLQ